MRSMMRKWHWQALFLGMVTTGIVACQDSKLSDVRLTTNTAEVVGVSPTELTISNRRTEGPVDTYYIATTASGAQYVCVVRGGGMLDAGPPRLPSCDRML